jgi:putative ABC transport system ATP-binding protein
MSEKLAGDIVLRTVRVGKSYPEGSVRALVDVSVEIVSGEYVAIMGPSGSGKSTLLNMLGALDQPTEGEVYFQNQVLSQVRNLDRFRCRQVGFIFQSFHLLPVLTASENVQVPMFETTASAASRAKRAHELLALVGMSHRQKHLPSQMSVGERQRVAIARALANHPAVLLADEPTGNLDSATAAEIIELFVRLHREHRMTIVMVTHDSAVARRAERIIRMRDGRVVSGRN